jgi:hypothetical protein
MFLVKALGMLVAILKHMFDGLRILLNVLPAFITFQILFLICLFQKSAVGDAYPPTLQL